MQTQVDLILLGRIALATLFAVAIGWDRERKSRPAGLRTHMLVGLSSALFVGLGEVYVARHALDHVNVDPGEQLGHKDAHTAPSA